MWEISKMNQLLPNKLLPSLEPKLQQQPLQLNLQEDSSDKQMLAKLNQDSKHKTYSEANQLKTKITPLSLQLLLTCLVDLQEINLKIKKINQLVALSSVSPIKQLLLEPLFRKTLARPTLPKPKLAL